MLADIWLVPLQDVVTLAIDAVKGYRNRWLLALFTNLTISGSLMYPVSEAKMATKFANGQH